MSDFTEHELMLMKSMSEQNKKLMASLGQDERKSLEKYVNPDNLAQVEATIGSDENIEHLLFWDGGAKFNDPHWAALSALDDATATVMAYARDEVQKLRELAVVIQRRSDLTLFSQFNAGLLFTGLAGAVRCNDLGMEDARGGRYSGVELRMIGSCGPMYSSICIIPEGDGYLIHYGAHEQGRATGITVNTADAFSLIQMAQMLGKDMAKAGLAASLRDADGNVRELDAKTIRKAAQAGESLGYPETMRLCCAERVQSIERAFEIACSLCRVFYERFGIEHDIFNIGRRYGNFELCRNEDFDSLLARASGKRGLVFLTATLVCRRCRREVEGFAVMAERYPDIQFALVNMNAPHGKFHERVFGDIAGGDPDQFVQKAKGVTPFTIIYTPDGRGGMTYRDYIATGKTEEPPSAAFVCSVMVGYFRK